MDPDALRAEVRDKYRQVALEPDAEHHFHIGRRLARQLGYPAEWVDGVPERAVEWPGSPTPSRCTGPRPATGSSTSAPGRVSTRSSPARLVGPTDQVVGVDMTPDMLVKARAEATLLALDNIEFRHGVAEDLPVDDGWADVVVANGVINLCANKRTVFDEIQRVLRPSGTLQFADIAGGLPCAGWRRLRDEAGFVDFRIGDPVDTFAGAPGEQKARIYDVLGYLFRATRSPE